MSALDQAFIKAYSKDASAPAAFGASAATLAAHATVPARPGVSPSSAAKPAALIENLYANGALYRLETAAAADAPGVPAPHYSPPASQQRTTLRRVAMRHRQAAEPLTEMSPPAVEPPPPAQRTPIRSLSEVARRMAHQLPRAPEIELPPEVLIVEEPESKPEAPSTEPPPEAKVESAASLAPAAPAASIEPAVAKEVVAADSSAIAAAAELWPADDVATLVEVCTPWEPINEAHVGSLVILADAPPFFSTMQENLVEVALELPTDQPAGDSDAAAANVQPAELRPPAKEVATAAPAEPASAAKTYRIDPPAPQSIAPPHFAPVPAPESEVSPAKEPAEQLASASLPELTPEETASLIGSLPQEPAAEQPSQVAAAAVLLSAEPLVPMWEVDRFQWPGICDRLMKDEHSYFAQAGGKLVAAAKDGLKVLGITGSRRGEGRTTLALCLARCAAQAGLNAALIDADFTRPQLASVIGLEVAYGWQDAAQGKIPLAEAAVKSLADKVTVLPLEASSVAWPLSLADKRVSATIRSVAQTHDLVIVDLGPMPAGGEPVFAVDEAAPLDAVIVLRDLRYATAAETHAIGERLHSSGVEAIGIAENFVPAENRSTV